MTFTLNAHDLDQDTLTFGATGLPSGATLTPGAVYGTATVTWTPTASDIGAHTVTFTVQDNGNNGQGASAQDSRTMRINVRATNQAPILAPIGDRHFAEGQAFTLQLNAVDGDGDMITYSASPLPPGANFDAQTGRFSWTPNPFQAGDYTLTFAASDGNASSSETVKLAVANTNQSPLFTYLPTQSAREGNTLTFSLLGVDPDGDAITYSALSSLPPGAFFDSKSGTLEWTPTYEQASVYNLTFAVSDVFGASAAQTVSIRVTNVDRAPVLTLAKHAVLLGQTLDFFAQGSDPDAGTALTYNAEDLPAGATLNAATGEIHWTPAPGQVGDFLVRVSVSDGTLSTMQPVLLRVLAAPLVPSVTIETTPSFPALPGQDVVVHVLADSFGPIAQRSLSVNGQSIALDANGQATIRATQPGKLQLVATGTDIDGFVGTTTYTLKVRDPNDKAAPTVVFDAVIADAIATAPINVVASVVDANLDYWSLEIAPQGSGDAFVELARGDAPVNGPLYTLNTNQWANGVYQLRLTAVDISGRKTQTITSLQVASSQKDARYLRAETHRDVGLVAEVACVLLRRGDL